MVGGGPFGGTRSLEIVKRCWSSGLLWKKIKLTTTRRANAKKRLHRVWQFQRLRDAIMMHNTARCSIGPPLGVGDLNLLENSPPKEKPVEVSPSSPNLQR